MSLAPGSKLGPYEILSLIGTGEVYRARDSRLDRIVVIKVSKEQFGERFEREGRAVAALNHPNIYHLYDVRLNYLVMEFRRGRSSKERIKFSGAFFFGETFWSGNRIKSEEPG